MDPERRAKWFEEIRKVQELEESFSQICICMRHFEQSNLANMKNAVPTIFDNNVSTHQIVQCDEINRLKRNVSDLENQRLKIQIELDIEKQKFSLKENRMKTQYEKEAQKNNQL